jgi:RNA polymerase sigma-70 factor (ECF subfamily)
LFVEEAPPFDEFMNRVRAGDELAALHVHRLFVHRLIALARSRLEKSLASKLDPEDVVQSVFRSFFVRCSMQQLDNIDGWESLWNLLALITVRKCHNKREHFFASRRDVRREVPLDGEGSGSQSVRLDDPTPAQAAVLTDLLEQLMRCLTDRERLILSLHLQGYTVPEICQLTGRAKRTVWRAIKFVRGQLEGMERGDRSAHSPASTEA